MAPSPKQFLPEGTDGLGLGESPRDSSNLNQLHGWIRSGHNCSERRAAAAFVHEALGGESAGPCGVVCEGALLLWPAVGEKHEVPLFLDVRITSACP